MYIIHVYVMGECWHYDFALIQVFTMLTFTDINCESKTRVHND